eukprot:1160801-Pelagomonas_calceolata.AAC.4
MMIQHSDSRQTKGSESLCVRKLERVREEAGELCQTLEKSEGKERAASEMADLLYHAMVLLNLQVRGIMLRSYTMLLI